MKKQNRAEAVYLDSQCVMNTLPKVHPLEPMGIGTPYMESLSSYLMRMSEAYWLSPMRFYKTALEPRQEDGAQWPISNMQFHYMGNGYGKYAKHMSYDIRTACCLPEASLMTFLAWKPLLDEKGHGLLRKHLQWCPQCWKADEASGLTPYTRLSWASQPVSICTIHRTELQSFCPTCGNPQNMVHRIPRQHICEHCGQSLHWHRHTSTYRGGDVSKDLWQATAIEDLILHTCGKGILLQSGCLGTALSDLIDSHCNGSLCKFAELISINQKYLEGWIYNAHKPRLDMLLDVCYRLDIPPHILLLQQKPLTAPSNWRKLHHKKYITLRKLSKTRLSQMRILLKKIIKDNPEPAPLIREIANSLGVTYTVLDYHFPEEMKMLRKRANEWRNHLRTKDGLTRVRNLESAVEKLIKKGVFPSQRQLKTLRLVRPSDLRRPEIKLRLKELQENLSHTPLDNANIQKFKEIRVEK